MPQHLPGQCRAIIAPMLVGKSVVLGAAVVALGCGRAVDDGQLKPTLAPDADCVDVPQFDEAQVNRTISREASTFGCREFTGGCTECCASAKDISGVPACSILHSGGESFALGPCDPACPPCAKCTIADEAALYELAPSVSCDCSATSGGLAGLGFNPDVPCERDCYYLRETVWSCPHKVCSN
jgi:hypothetical protein